MHDYISGKLPNSFDGEFPHNRDIMNYKCTRQSELLYIPKYSTKYSQNSPAYHLPKLWNTWARLFPENVTKNVMKIFIKTKFTQKYQEHVKCQNIRCPIVTPHHNVKCNLHDLLLSSLLDVMLHIINHLVNIVNDYPAITPISPASAGHTEIIPVHNISHFNYYYYSYRDCGKTATY